MAETSAAVAGDMDRPARPPTAYLPEVGPTLGSPARAAPLAIADLVRCIDRMDSPLRLSRHHVPEPPLVKEKEESVEEHTVVAMDVAKAVFELAVSEEPGRVKLHRRLSRGELEVFFAQARRSTVVMEACGSAHHWGRQLEGLGHKVVLLPPHQVRPYVTRNKTDRADAKGILEAYRNADIRPVPVKSIPQQVLGSIHRFRSGWISSRTAQVNTLRGPASRTRVRHSRGDREGSTPGATSGCRCRLGPSGLAALDDHCRVRRNRISRRADSPG